MKKTRLLSLTGTQVRKSRRRGFTTPAVAIALLVVMAGLALVLDRLWLDTADLELTTAAEAAALAAASELANDDLLKLNAVPELRFERARAAAAWIASQNLVAGSPVVLNTDPEGDIRLGRLLLDTESDLVKFSETTENPTTAVVTAIRSRRTNNPVGLFVAGATGQSQGDVATRVEASIDNRISGVRAAKGTPVPALPIAIWWRDPSGVRPDTWENQIDNRLGADLYTYDPVSHAVSGGGDGIPEIVLRSQARGSQTTSANVLVVDVGAGLNDQTLQRQFTSGWTADDLGATDGEFNVSLATPMALNASGELPHSDRESLDTLVGEPRICLLYSTAVPSGKGSLVQATCMQMVAIRIMAVRDQSDGSCEVVAQPCVIKTKTAMLLLPSPYSTDSVILGNPTKSVTTSPGNPYIYKLQLTH